MNSSIIVIHKNKSITINAKEISKITLLQFHSNCKQKYKTNNTFKNTKQEIMEIIQNCVDEIGIIEMY